MDTLPRGGGCVKMLIFFLPFSEKGSSLKEFVQERKQEITKAVPLVKKKKEENLPSAPILFKRNVFGEGNAIFNLII